MTGPSDEKLAAVERVAEALARGVEARRVHWLSIADRLALTERGAARFMQRENENFHRGRGR
jgi:hypothetical protein